MAQRRAYPRRTLEQALRVPAVIKEHNAGNPWKTEEVAKALNVGATSSNFFYITAASRDYGLTEGTRDAGQISLTPLGRQAVYPGSAEEERQAKLQAFANVESFRSVLEYYKGNNLPERQFLANTLVDEFNIPTDHHDEFLDIFTKNCRYLGIGKTFSISDALTGERRHPRERPPVGESDERDTITVGAPDDVQDAPVCFVIMPFTERDDAHPPGFFDEVLDYLFTPAAKEAGFRVTTARRQGSDVIQSTIVNDLLEADLVLCDLTEHNPNVLFELGMRIMEEKPVALVKALGTGPIFDVDNMLRVVQYDPNLWSSTVATDLPKIKEHIAATWENRDTGRTFMQILRDQSSR